MPRRCVCAAQYVWSVEWCESGCVGEYVKFLWLCLDLSTVMGGGRGRARRQCGSEFRGPITWYDGRSGEHDNEWGGVEHTRSGHGGTASERARQKQKTGRKTKGENRGGDAGNSRNKGKTNGRRGGGRASDDRREGRALGTPGLVGAGENKGTAGVPPFPHPPCLHLPLGCSTRTAPGCPT